MNRPRILIVDDEVEFLEDLREYLGENGYEAVAATDGEAALSAARQQAPDLVILDVRMPGMSGLEVCRRLRQGNADLPVIFLSALHQDVDKVRGLETGGDDYIAKPFSAIELLARIKSLLRRAKPAEKKAPVRFGDVTLDPVRREVVRAGQPVSCTPKEFDLLCYLVEHDGEALSREHLLVAVWGHEVHPTTRTVDIHILHLRKKLEVEPSAPRHFLTVHGVGYKFVGEEKAPSPADP